jgi:serine/threonine protein kinase
MASRSGSLEEGLLVFRQYVLKTFLGRGPLGAAWMVLHKSIGREMAARFVPEAWTRNQSAMSALQGQVRKLLEITHPNIVSVQDFVTDGNMAAIITKYVEAEPLHEVKARAVDRSFTVNDVQPWLAQLCEALDFAWRQHQAIHGDISPLNLLITRQGDLRVGDLGLARSLFDVRDSEGQPLMTGTLAYISPERSSGAPVTPADDVYAFGATVYDLLTSRPPFFRGNVLFQLQSVVPPSMTERRMEFSILGDQIPSEWEEVIAACLAKKPGDRPRSIREVGERLGLLLPSTGEAPLPTVLPRPEAQRTEFRMPIRSLAREAVVTYPTEIKTISMEPNTLVGDVRAAMAAEAQESVPTQVMYPKEEEEAEGLTMVGARISPSPEAPAADDGADTVVPPDPPPPSAAPAAAAPELSTPGSDSTQPHPPETSPTRRAEEEEDIEPVTIVGVPLPLPARAPEPEIDESAQTYVPPDPAPVAIAPAPARLSETAAGIHSHEEPPATVDDIEPMNMMEVPTENPPVASGETTAGAAPEADDVLEPASAATAATIPIVEPEGVTSDPAEVPSAPPQPAISGEELDAKIELLPAAPAEPAPAAPVEESQLDGLEAPRSRVEQAPEAANEAASPSDVQGVPASVPDAPDIPPQGLESTREHVPPAPPPPAQDEIPVEDLEATIARVEPAPTGPGEDVSQAKEPAAPAPVQAPLEPEIPPEDLEATVEQLPPQPPPSPQPAAKEPEIPVSELEATVEQIPARVPPPPLPAPVPVAAPAPEPMAPAPPPLPAPAPVAAPVPIPVASAPPPVPVAAVLPPPLPAAKPPPLADTEIPADLEATRPKQPSQALPPPPKTPTPPPGDLGPEIPRAKLEQSVTRVAPEQPAIPAPPKEPPSAILPMPMPAATAVPTIQPTSLKRFIPWIVGGIVVLALLTGGVVKLLSRKKHATPTPVPMASTPAAATPAAITPRPTPVPVTTPKPPPPTPVPVPVPTGRSIAASGLAALGGKGRLTESIALVGQFKVSSAMPPLSADQQVQVIARPVEPALSEKIRIVFQLRPRSTPPAEGSTMTLTPESRYVIREVEVRENGSMNVTVMGP